MQTVIQSAPAVFAAILIFVGMKLFSIPIRRLFRFFLQTALGFAVLAVWDHFATYLPFALGFNWFNAAVIGLLGLPGLGLLILLKLVL